MISVCTIVAGRREHLANQARGLAASEVIADEWVVVGMNETPTVPDIAAGRAAQAVVTTRVDVEDRLPLAEARNAAAEWARGDVLVFLDVDCIPHPAMLSAFLQTLEQDDRLWMGDVRYLPRGAADGKWDFGSLQSVSVEHPLLPTLDGRPLPTDRYEGFWSLCFACTPQTWRQIGGFDTDYGGYGGEDTDFAFSARKAGVPFGHCPAMAFHQHHTVCKPPLNHFDSIVRNARRFRKKWGLWPMESWLRQFAERGLLRYDETSDDWQVLRSPNESEVAACRVDTPAGF